MGKVATQAVLRFLLESVKEQAIYAHRQQGWLIALWETVAADEKLQARLKAHPLYRQVPQPALGRIDVLVSNIDVLIRQLSDDD